MKKVDESVASLQLTESIEEMTARIECIEAETVQLSERLDGLSRTLAEFQEALDSLWRVSATRNASRLLGRLEDLRSRLWTRLVR